MCGSLGNVRKMPCRSYGFSAEACITGNKLRKIPGSVCAGCNVYNKGNYLYESVKKAHFIRLSAIQSNITKWEKDITCKIRKEEKTGRFRWHDSGDIQSPEHLQAVINVAKSLPHIQFWLPSKEYSMLMDLPESNVPSNLTIRVSAPMVGKAFKGLFGGKFVTSSVGTCKGFQCPATYKAEKSNPDTHTCQYHNCGACWDKTIENVDYKKG